MHASRGIPPRHRRAFATVFAAFGTLVVGSLAVGSLVVVTQRPAESAALRVPRLKLTTVMKAQAPVGLVSHANSAELVVIEQGGILRALGSGRVILDVTDEVSDGGEQGLLGLAFSNDGTKLYVNLTNLAGHTEIREYSYETDKAAEESRRLLLTIEQPFPNHNGGQLAVDRNGLLWIGTGDGGSAGDPQRNGQNRHTLLGKILRIDPKPSGSSPYTIPPTNPYRDGKAGLPEIWAFGLRNPWRFSFDYLSGTVWIADVGQNAWEEINAVPINRAGLNFGWSKREARDPYKGGAKPAGAIDPVYQYSHDEGCSVTGGYVYRARKIPALVGSYVFADYCRGALIALSQTAGSKTWRATDLGVKAKAVSSFGVDAAGNLYVTSLDGPIYRLDPA